MNRRRIAYLATLILALIGVSFFGGPVIYLFLWAVLFLPVSSAVYILYVITFLKIYQRTDGRSMVSGTASEFYITLQNEGPFSFSALQLHFFSSFSGLTDLREETVYELPAGASVKKTTGLLCRYRGEYRVGISKVTVWDHLGLFSHTFRIREPLSVIVAPALLAVTEPKSLVQFSDADRDSAVNRTFPDISVREYLPGDDLRLIHWKSSAVLQKLMVRELTGEEKSHIAILMDGKRYGRSMEQYLPVENRIIETVLSLSEYYMRNHIPADVMLRKGHAYRQAVRDAGGFEKLYGEMHAYSFREDHGIRKLLAECGEEMAAADHRMWIFVVHEWGAEEEALLSRYNTSRVPVILYLVSDAAEENPQQEAGVCFRYRIRTDAALQEVL